ncbi:hypothetical protein KC218_22825, partial [Mycobacterium tuberculosis]|nr:hypothetical protein [Mycobacterium tuberculosis]
AEATGVDPDNIVLADDGWVVHLKDGHAEVVGAVRAAVGSDIQLCVDHFGEGFMTADEVIRFGRALEDFDLAWIEDPVQFFDVAGHKKVSDA